jgi:hypothetical protein
MDLVGRLNSEKSAWFLLMKTQFSMGEKGCSCSASPKKRSTYSVEMVIKN